MGCPNCATHVRNSLLTLKGVIQAEVDYRNGLAIIEHNPRLARVGHLIQAVALAGGDRRHEYRAQPL